MKLPFSAVTFSIVFCFAYAAIYWFNQPLFLYYPMTGAFTWGSAALKDSGPGMAWYGLMANALIASFVLALAVPDRVSGRIFRNYLWVFPVGTMLICAYLLRNFFLQG